MSILKQMQKGNEIIAFIKEQKSIYAFYQQLIKQTITHVKKIGNELTAENVYKNLKLQLGAMYMISESTQLIIEEYDKMIDYLNKKIEELNKKLKEEKNQSTLNENLKLLDLIDSVIKNKDEDAVLMTVLSDLQLAYERKDYVDIADILLHQLQKYFESL